MLYGNLLISNEAIKAIIIAAVCVFGISSVLYGVFRKFTQMGWLAWQLPIIFFIALLCDCLPETLDSNTRFAVSSVIFLVGSGAVFGLGLVVRHYMHYKLRPAAVGWRATDRVLGGVTALLGYAVFLLVVGGLALSVIDICVPSVKGMFDVVYTNKIWTDVLASHAFDFFVIAILAMTIQSGYRVGLGRAFVTVLMCVLVAACLVCALYITCFVPFFRAFAQLFASAFKEADALVANVSGFAIAVVVEFIVMFSICALLGFLLHKLVNRIRYVRVLGIIDGVLLAVLFFALILVLACSINFTVYWVGNLFETAEFAEQLAEYELPVETIVEWGKTIERLFTSSPFSRLLYEYNPLKEIYQSFIALA